ncbi:hypothetical protein BDW74DRAFT_91238 [Aspergillus multicolor]|uniref:uncharacterized protein n=1 Tax=Aspergillus multicolor TaxID=41759 RepID=UPI003CCD2AAF
MSGSFDNSDLRQAGTAAKRVNDHKAKWVHGGRSARPGHSLLDDVLPITRPAKQQSTSWSRRQRTRDTQHNTTLAKLDLRNDVREALDEGTSESSGVEDHGNLPVTTTMPEVFHAEGPVDLYEVTGQMLFNDVIDKAVEKFEVKETEKLVKEYEFITRESEVSIGYLADEDDFELVDHVKL